MSTTSYYSKELGRLLTEAELAAMPVVRWRKKGCTTCQPVTVVTRPANELVKPSTAK